MVGNTSKLFVVILVLFSLISADDADARRRRRRNRGNNLGFLLALQRANLLNALFASQANLTGLGGSFPGIHGGAGGIDLRPIDNTLKATPTQSPGGNGNGSGGGAACDQTKALNALNASKGRCTGCHASVDFKIENSKVVITGTPAGTSDIAGFVRAVGRGGQMKGVEDVMKMFEPASCTN